MIDKISSEKLIRYAQVFVIDELLNYTTSNPICHGKTRLISG